MSGQIKFGTDGWRAIIAEDYTFDNVRICAQGLASYLLATTGKAANAVVGYDTRFGSEDFAAATAEVLAANGIHTYLCTSATPTPVVSHAVVDRTANAGVVITASHNPGRWNGFKIKGPDGSSAEVEVIAEVEREIGVLVSSSTGVRRVDLDTAVSQGLVTMYDPAPRYKEQLRRLVDIEAIKGMDATVAVDSMYGAGSGYLADLLTGGKIRIDEIHAERNPLFPGIRPEPIGPNLAALFARVTAKKAALGIATDGDADRVGLVDENGVFLNQHQVFALLCYYLLSVRKERGDIIRSVTTTEMISLLGTKYGVPVTVTRVGFKYIAPLMLERNALIGGEESGGYGFRGHIPERDGILAPLYFLDFMRQTGKTPSQLLQELYALVGEHHYDRADVELHHDDHARVAADLKKLRPSKVDGVAVREVDLTDGVRLVLDDGAWVLYRLSGTEPLLRIYSEAESQKRVWELIREGGRLLGITVK
jgi:phosphomannomutase